MSNGNNGNRSSAGPTWEATSGFFPLIFARRNGNGQKPAGGPGNGSEFLREHARSAKPPLAAEKKGDRRGESYHDDDVGELIQQLMARHTEGLKVTPREDGWETAR